MVMVLHVVAACRRREVKLMAGDIEVPAGGRESAVELVVGIFHAILGEYRLQTALVEWPVVRNEGKTLNQRLDSRPYFRECRLYVRVAPGKSMELGGRLLNSVLPGSLVKGIFPKVFAYGLAGLCLEKAHKVVGFREAEPVRYGFGRALRPY